MRLIDVRGADVRARIGTAVAFGISLLLTAVAAASVGTLLAAPSLAGEPAPVVLKNDTRYTVEAALPENLQPGLFQGLFFETVAATFTADIR